MPNSIEYAKKFVPIIDGIYKAAAVTQGMDAATRADFTGVNEVKVLKVSTTGLGDYSRENGYPKGDVTAVWETMQLTEERGKEISVDRMDNEETLGLTFGTVTGEFMRLHVIPELDAYRFAKYASKSGISTVTGAVLTKTTIIEAIDEAVRQMNADEVPLEGRKLYLNSDLQPILNSALNRQWGSDGTVNTVLSGYNNMPITWVPPTRFYTALTLNPGTANWGYAKGAGAADVNFMIIYPPSILQVQKFALPKIFDPDTNQDKDAWKFQFRLYHDAFVYDNKVKGIYLHKKPVA
ncbi:hypothetical protein Sgly_0340 [Syntrophobotulus glycolicus DSM 8271]|uniref:Uncharacterized protein n=1 Tax=Syntrophobotulus glycolicus (strain DSM 8271 / FlGlyR) TaxID=645991 RepID=F0SXG0_SYNGF|nr:hypothetical protein Sgly_0340 [Syntrophobotulus glycolicus DSM 8271]